MILASPALNIYQALNNYKMNVANPAALTLSYEDSERLKRRPSTLGAPWPHRAPRYFLPAGKPPLHDLLQTMGQGEGVFTALGAAPWPPAGARDIEMEILHPPEVFQQVPDTLLGEEGWRQGSGVTGQGYAGEPPGKLFRDTPHCLGLTPRYNYAPTT